MGLWQTHGALGVRRRLMSFGMQKPARKVESPDPLRLRTFTILLTLVSSLVERPQSVRDRQALAQWCTLMLLPIGIAIFSAKGFLSLGWATLLVICTFEGRRWLRTGISILHRCCQRKLGEETRSSERAGRTLEYSDPSWISLATALLTIALMFSIFHLLHIGFSAVTVFGLVFVMVEAFNRLMSTPAVRAKTQLVFFLSVVIYLSPFALGGHYR